MLLKTGKVGEMLFRVGEMLFRVDKTGKVGEMLFRIKIKKKVLIYQHFLTNKCFKLLYSLFQQSP